MGSTRGSVKQSIAPGDSSATQISPPSLETMCLAIARHIVSRLGGEIWVADEADGATLCFTLPRAEAPV